MDFKRGLKDGLPIGLGYFPVSFGFGLMVISNNLDAFTAIAISMTNLTSAGQVAGLAVIAAMGSYAEIAFTEFVINIRYALMSLSLSQKLDKSFTLGHRFIAAFGITDEIFAVASAKPKEINVKYMYGLMVLPIVGWNLGTITGALAGNVLPEALKAALGMAIYGMFIAIVVPAAKRHKGILFTAIVAVAVSLIMRYAPVLKTVSPGFAIIISAVIAAALAAWLFPVKEEEQ
ncbi:MAG: AzlC family ABC transporter permease [Lachnospiraceae bacterium]|nr:AzlC family ABC transporter permease [Lachnospiraceae bacterium]